MYTIDMSDLLQNFAGRPSLLDDDLKEKALEYLYVNGKDKAGWALQGDKIPSIEGLAGYLGVNRDSLYEWASKDDVFSDILEETRRQQAQMLIDNGLTSVFNSTITKLMLSKHGYIEKSEKDLTSGGKPIDTGVTDEMKAKFLEFMKQDTKG